MDELMDQFALEARDLVQQASDDLLALEQTPDDRARLQSSFRAIHTLKGSVGLFDLGPMQDVLHQAEDLLTRALGAQIDIDVGFIDPLLGAVQWVDLCLDDIARDGTLSPDITSQAKQILADLKGEQALADEPQQEIISQETPEWATALLIEAGASEAKGLVALRYVPHPECFFNGDDPLAALSRLPNIRHLKISPREPWGDKASYDPFRCNLVIEALTAAPLGDIEALFRLIPDQVAIVGLTAAKTNDLKPAETIRERQAPTMRVDAARIDALLEIAGELVTAKNALLPLADDARESTGDERLSRRILSSHQEIERLVGALYGAVTQARLVPLAQTFRRFPRLVRETAARLGKSVEFIMEGDSVEADREIVEELFEPLLHLVRNALDHGIETEAERLQSGKPARGTLTLRARQKGELIEVTLQDDGRGIDPAKIRAAALVKGLLTPAAAESLSDTAALQLLFLSGFSTASTVTDLSGRGVGLDAVKASVQRLGGRVELLSTPGVGTKTQLLLPISFAMSRIMVVEVGGERYGVPIDGIIETIRLRAGDVMPVRAGEAFVLRDRTIPLLRLSELLQLPASEPGRDLRVLIAKAGDEQVGIAVDAIAERAETLLRPLAGLLKGLPGIAGTTLLGDGKVLLVLNLEELIG